MSTYSYSPFLNACENGNLVEMIDIVNKKEIMISIFNTREQHEESKQRKDIVSPYDSLLKELEKERILQGIKIAYKNKHEDIVEYLKKLQKL